MKAKRLGFSFSGRKWKENFRALFLLPFYDLKALVVGTAFRENYSLRNFSATLVTTNQLRSQWLARQDIKFSSIQDLFLQLFSRKKQEENINRNVCCQKPISSPGKFTQTPRASEVPRNLRGANKFRPPVRLPKSLIRRNNRADSQRTFYALLTDDLSRSRTEHQLSWSEGNFSVKRCKNLGLGLLFWEKGKTLRWAFPFLLALVLSPSRTEKSFLLPKLTSKHRERCCCLENLRCSSRLRAKLLFIFLALLKSADDDDGEWNFHLRFGLFFHSFAFLLRWCWRSFSHLNYRTHVYVDAAWLIFLSCRSFLI